MKQVQILKFGQPEDVARVVEVAAPTLKADDDVLVRVQLAPIGPADIGTLWGGYPRPYPGSVVPGIEAIGVIEAYGPTVKDLKVGDRVLVVRFDCWSEQLVLKRHQVVKVSEQTDIFQQFNLKVNGATAEHLLSQIVQLDPGDWVVQNAANSTAGQYLVQIARARGIRTINIVRTEEAAAHVRQLGGDIVLVDGPDLAAAARKAVQGDPIQLAIDCVGGNASGQLTDILSEGGTLVVYGALSLQPVQIPPLHFITKNIRVRGFWITPWLMNAPNSEIQELMDELDALVTAGKLKTEVAKLVPLENIAEALRLAGAGGRNGKVLLDFRNA